MRRRRVVFRPSSRDNLDALYHYIRRQGGLGYVAKAYIRLIQDRCRRIGDAPFGGVPREDLGSGIRMTVFERRIVIVYRVEDDTVWITNIFSGGRDYEALFGGRRNIPSDDPD